MLQASGMQAGAQGRLPAQDWGRSGKGRQGLLSQKGAHLGRTAVQRAHDGSGPQRKEGTMWDPPSLVP